MRALSNEDRETAFLRATGGFSGARERWKNRAREGRTDEQLADDLKFEIGIFGGCGGPESLNITYQGSGLKIWASWHVHNHVREKPIFQGAATIAMARHTYGIPNPDDDQLSLI